MCGKRSATVGWPPSRRGATLRGGSGHRGLGRTPGHGRDHGPRRQVVDALSATGFPCRGRRRTSSTGGASPPPSPSVPTGCGSAPGSSPRPRPGHPGYKERLLEMHGHEMVSRAFTGKTCRVRNAYTNEYDPRDQAVPRPVRAVDRGRRQPPRGRARHRGSTGPAGQGVGAIAGARPLSCLFVRRQAEAVLDRVSSRRPHRSPRWLTGSVVDRPCEPPW